MICNRPFLLKFVIIFTYEEILNGKPTIITGQNFIGQFDGRQKYTDQVYTNEKYLDQIKQVGQSSAIRRFDEKFVLLNYGKDFCSNFYGSMEEKYDPDKEEGDLQICTFFTFIDCLKVAQGFANNGLKLSITAILSKCNDIIVRYSLSEKTDATTKALINDDDLTYSGNNQHPHDPMISYIS